MNYLYKEVYTTLYFSMNNLNALNRMLTVKIRVNDRLVYQKGSNEQYCAEHNDVFVAPLSGSTRLVDPNQFRDARLVLFIYFLFIYLF